MTLADAGRRVRSIVGPRKSRGRVASLVATFLCLFALATTASATELTLFADGVPAVGADVPVRSDDIFEVTVGIDDVFALLQYDIDILYDETVVTVDGASQLACLDDGITCEPFAFTIDPTDPNSAEQGRRSAALTLPPNLLSIDPADTGEPNPVLFSITFRVIDQLAFNEVSEIQFGILDERANEITDADGMSLIPALTAANAEIVSLSLIPEPVPEPAAGLMSLVALTALAALRSRR